MSFANRSRVLARRDATGSGWGRANAERAFGTRASMRRDAPARSPPRRLSRRNSTMCIVCASSTEAVRKRGYFLITVVTSGAGENRAPGTGAGAHVIGILLGSILDEGVTLMRVGHAIFWHVHVGHRASLDEYFPRDLLGDL